MTMTHYCDGIGDSLGVVMGLECLHKNNISLIIHGKINPINICLEFG
jgi:hypothetical protein